MIANQDDAAWNRLKERMYAICDVAATHGIGILIDAEEPGFKTQLIA